MNDVIVFVAFVTIDINECIASSSLCAANAQCENNEGSYVCSCNTGFTGNGKTCNGKRDLILDSITYEVFFNAYFHLQ